MSGIRTSWPEVVGWPASAAAAQIRSDRPDVHIEVLPVGTSVPPGYNSLRVRVYFDTNYGDTDPVVYAPVVGQRVLAGAR